MGWTGIGTSCTGFPDESSLLANAAFSRTDSQESRADSWVQMSCDADGLTD